MANNTSEKNLATEENSDEFIPYACHINDHTILTKNGELMQVIKITGFAFESVHDEGDKNYTVRDAIRNAILTNVDSNKIAVWFHTIRRKNDLSSSSPYKTYFADRINNSWNELNGWKNKYVNEVYISIIHEGQNLSTKDIKAFFRCIYFPYEFKYRETYLNESAEKLDILSRKILKSLKSYGARRLKIVCKEDKKYYSEISSFLGKIINLKEENFLIAPLDLSTSLINSETTFGFNTIKTSPLQKSDEIKTKKNKSSLYSGILSIKEYHNVSTKAIDLFLQQEHEYIVTETFDYINHIKVQESYEEQRNLYEVSEDDKLLNLSGLRDILNTESTDLSLAYGEHQITILMLEDSPKKLEKSMIDAVIAFQDLGIVIVREDIFLEDCYWSQLPANFEFCKRMSSVASKFVAGYASLYNFPAGQRYGNLWGESVSLFYTSYYTPYFFNFHLEDNGHSFIIGPHGSGKTVLLNFFIAQSTKFNPRVFFFDQNNMSQIFINALEGSYNVMSRSDDQQDLHFNPLKLPDTNKNREFLKKWFAYLIVQNHTRVSTKQKNKIEAAVRFVFELPIEERKISNIIPKFWSKEDDDNELGTIEDELSKKDNEPQKMEELLSDDSEEEEEEKEEEINYEIDDIRTVWEKISEWYGEGDLAYFFDNDDDDFNLHDVDIWGFDMTQLVSVRTTLVPVIFYLLHQINRTLDGTPTIIVLDEAWDIIDNPAFNNEIKEWLAELKRKNAIAIFATESVDGAEKSPMTKVLAKNIKTKIFLPNKQASEVGYEEIFGLSDEEFKMLQKMDSYKREFLLIHDIDAVVASLNLKTIKTELAILSASPNNLVVFNDVIQANGLDPEKWIPAFEEKI